MVSGGVLHFGGQYGAMGPSVLMLYVFVLGEEWLFVRVLFTLFTWCMCMYEYICLYMCIYIYLFFSFCGCVWGEDCGVEIYYNE